MQKMGNNQRNLEKWAWTLYFLPGFEIVSKTARESELICGFQNAKMNICIFYANTGFLYFVNAQYIEKEINCGC